jgi:hypothetical protein
MAKSTSQLAAEFLAKHIRATGTQLSYVEHLDSKQKTYVPSPVQDADALEYISSLSIGEDAERGVKYEICDEEIADFDSEDYSPDKVEEEQEPKEPEIILQSLHAATEYIYSIEESGRVVWCWHREDACRVKLCDLDSVLQRLADQRIEALAQWV